MFSLKINRILSATFIVFSFLSCTEQQEEKGIILYDNLTTEGDVNGFCLENHLDLVSIVPLELNDESILGDCKIIDDIWGQLFLLDRHESVCSFNNQTGKFISRINKRGQGQGEYVSIMDAIVHPKDSALYVLDISQGNIHKYLLNGQFEESVSNDSITALALSDEGNWLALTTPLKNCEYDICVYDAQWNLTGETSKRIRKHTFKHLINTGSFLKFNGNIYTYVSDTLFRIGNDGTKETSIHINKGNLRMPDEIRSDLSKKSEWMRYIWGDKIICNSKYYFISYYYDNNIFFDIWNNEKQLCYRNIVNPNSNPESVKLGFPIKIKEHTIYTWPSFVKGDLLYCMIDEVEAEKLSSSDEECNPCILKIKLK